MKSKKWLSSETLFVFFGRPLTFWRCFLLISLWPRSVSQLLLIFPTEIALFIPDFGWACSWQLSKLDSYHTNQSRVQLSCCQFDSSSRDSPRSSRGPVHHVQPHISSTIRTSALLPSALPAPWPPHSCRRELFPCPNLPRIPFQSSSGGLSLQHGACPCSPPCCTPHRGVSSLSCWRWAPNAPSKWVWQPFPHLSPLLTILGFKYIPCPRPVSLSDFRCGDHFGVPMGRGSCTQRPSQQGSAASLSKGSHARKGKMVSYTLKPGKHHKHEPGHNLY